MAIPASGTATPSISQAAFLKLTTAQQDAYVEKQLTGFGGTFKPPAGSQYGQYAGDSALAFYKGLRTSGETPIVALAVVYSQWLGQGLTGAVGDIVGATGTALGATATGIETASIIPSWADGLAGLLSDLESPQTWLRIAEGILGILLIATAVSHMTGAGNAVGKAARALPLVT